MVGSGKLTNILDEKGEKLRIEKMGLRERKRRLEKNLVGKNELLENERVKERKGCILGI